MEYDNNKKYITNTTNKREKNEKKNRYILKFVGFSLGHIVAFPGLGFA
jgi:hypothetical protein